MPDETIDNLTDRLNRSLTMSQNTISGSALTGLTELQKKQIRDLIKETLETGPLPRKVDELNKNFQRLRGVNSVEEYRAQVIDEAIVCTESLDVIKSLPTFDGKTSYVSWREAANNSMSLYKPGSRKYYAALTILRNKIIDESNDILTNHGTVLNLEAILSRLDFAYSDKRPLHIIEQEISIMRQGSQTILDYYNEVNKKLTALINKTIMTHGTNGELTNELNRKNRQHALRVFITGLNPPLANILFSLGPTDLPNALAKAQELESNNIRANFALQFNRTSYVNPNQKSQNTLRFPQRNERNFPRNKFFQNEQMQPKPIPMDLGSSANIVQRPQQPFNNGYNFRPAFNNPNFAHRNNSNYVRSYNQNNFQQGIKRQQPSGQISFQPQHKAQRVNNINEDTFLEIIPDCPILEKEEHPDEHIEY